MSGAGVARRGGRAGCRRIELEEVRGFHAPIMGINPVSSIFRRRGVERGHMLDQARRATPQAVTTSSSSSQAPEAAGAYHCSECGYGITLHAELPQCPMCAGTTWELRDWSPFTQPSGCESPGR